MDESWQVYEYETCPRCHGLGTLDEYDEDSYCDRCWGDGEIAVPIPPRRIQREENSSDQVSS